MSCRLIGPTPSGCSAQGDLVNLRFGSFYSKHGYVVQAHWPHAEWLLRAGRFGQLEVWFLLLEARICRAGLLAPRRVAAPRRAIWPPRGLVPSARSTDTSCRLIGPTPSGCSAQGDMATSRSGSICSKRGYIVQAHWPHAEWLLIGRPLRGRSGQLDGCRSPRVEEAVSKPPIRHES